MATLLTSSRSDTGAAWQPLGNIRSLDGLRAIAVMAVIAYHGNWFGITGGFIGVDLFFALSGFLITRLLLDEHHRDGGISLGGFYLRRGIRLLPALFAVVAGVWFFALILDDPFLDNRIGSRGLWALSYVANWRDVVTRTHSGPFSHLWSLSVEEQFYVIWPVVVVALLRWRGPVAVNRCAAALALLLAALTAVRYWSGVSGMVLYFGTDSHGAILLLAGSWLGASPKLLDSIEIRMAQLALGVSLAGFAVFALAEDRFNVMHLGVGYAPITIISLLAVAAAVVLPQVPILSANPLRQIGKSSYAIYLWHIPMFTITRILAPGVDPRIRILVGTAVATVASHWLVEKPAQRLRRRWA